jgi:Replication initiation factor
MTPPTDRGVYSPSDASVVGSACTDVGLGWLSVTMRADRPTERGHLVRQVLHAVGDVGRVREHGLKGYPQALDVLTGSAVGWTDERPTEVHLTLKQSDCSWERFDAVMAIATAAANCKVTRLDLNVDDLGRRVRPLEVLAAYRGGDVVSRLQKSSDGSVYGRDGRILQESVYLGALGGDRSLNVYDKDLERANVTGKPVELGTHGIRWELRLRDERATRAAGELNSSRKNAVHFWRLVLGLVDFRTRSADRQHGSRRTARAPWFAELVGDLEREPVYSQRVPEDPWTRAWRLRRWIVSVAAPLAEVAEVEPEWFVRELLRGGFERLAARRSRASSAAAVA